MNGAGCSRPKDMVGSVSDYLCRLVLRGTDILQSDRERPRAFEDSVAIVSRSPQLNQQSLPTSTVGLFSRNALSRWSTRSVLPEQQLVQRASCIVTRKDQRVLVNNLRSYVELRKVPITRQSMVESTDLPARMSERTMPKVRAACSKPCLDRPRNFRSHG